MGEYSVPRRGPVARLILPSFARWFSIGCPRKGEKSPSGVPSARLLRPGDIDGNEKGRWFPSGPLVDSLRFAYAKSTFGSGAKLSSPPKWTSLSSLWLG